VQAETQLRVLTSKQQQLQKQKSEASAELAERVAGAEAQRAAQRTLEEKLAHLQRYGLHASVLVEIEKLNQSVFVVLVIDGQVGIWMRLKRRGLQLNLVRD
jgi:hypothetical protein